MRRLLGVGAAICAATWLTSAPVGGGWLWDMGNGFGFVALTLMFALGFEPGSSRMHRMLAWFAVGTAMLHGVYILTLDATVLEYLRPTMPAYMGAGLFALLLLALVAAASSSRWRRRFFGRRDFRAAHGALSVLILISAAYHVVGSGFYINHWLGATLLLGLLAACATWPRLVRWRGIAQAPAAEPQAVAVVVRRVLLLILMVVALLVAPRNF